MRIYMDLGGPELCSTNQSTFLPLIRSLTSKRIDHRRKQQNDSADNQGDRRSYFGEILECIAAVFLDHKVRLEASGIDEGTRGGDHDNHREWLETYAQHLSQRKSDREHERCRGGIADQISHDNGPSEDDCKGNAWTAAANNCAQLSDYCRQATSGNGRFQPKCPPNTAIVFHWTQ